MLKKYTLLLVLIIQCLVFQLPAAPVNNLNVDNGLSNNFIHTVFQDSDGFIWIGTETGLDRYDGVSVKSYALRFNPPLKGAVQSIAETAPGNLILGTSWGAFIYNFRSNKIKAFDFGVQGIDVRAVALDKAGTIYFGTDKGLYKLSHVPRLVSDYPVIAFAKNDKQEVYAVSDNKLMLISSGDLKPFHLNIPSVKSACFSGESLFLGTISGLYALDVKTNEIKAVGDFKNISVLAVSEVGKGVLYTGTDNFGLIKYDLKTGKQEQLQHNTNGLSSNSIYAIYHTQGVLFSGTFDHGLDIIPLKTASKFHTVDILTKTGSTVRSQYIDSNGFRYLGTRDGHFICLDKNGKILYNINSGFQSRVITTIAAYPGNDNLLLVGTFGDGIQLFDKLKRRFCKLTYEGSVKNARVYKFLTFNNNEIWIATLNGLIRYEVKSGNISRYDLQVACGSNELFSLTSDEKNNIWIGAKTGICYFDTKNLKVSQSAELNKYRYQCSSVYRDSKNNIWFCFNKGGVLKINNKAQPEIWLTKEIMIPENAPSSVIEDNHGRIWIGSSKGLFVLNNLNEIHSFGREDGLEGMNICPESALMDDNGKLWWSNEFGLISFIDNNKSVNNYLPNLQLNSLVVNGSDYDPDTLDFVQKKSGNEYEIRLKGKSKNNVGFGFTALSYVFPHKNRFFVRLLGSDSTFVSLPVGQNAVSYNNLATGAHFLEVIAANNDGIRSTEPLILKLVISPYFYETAWFVLLLILAGSLVLVYFTRHYIRLMRSRLTQQFSEIKRNRQQTPLLKIPENKGNDIISSLKQWMETDKAYLNSELRQADVADAISCQVHELSQVLNVQLGQSFPDFVNNYRINEFLYQVKQPESDKYTLTAIAMQCGFSSKSSFLRAFKKVTGMTPSEYLRGN